MIFADLEYPPIENLIEWPAFLFEDNTLLAFNKIGLIHLISFAVPTILFLIAGRQRTKVPTGARNFVEVLVGFVERTIVLQVIGPQGLRYLPFLMSLFVFIFLGNIFEIVPAFHMPAHARMGGPLVYAILVFGMFVLVGLKHQGLHYFKEVLFPPGIPKVLYVLVTPIELFSTFLMRPFSLAIRLFANLLAGHILLVTFSVLSITVWQLSPLAVLLAGTFPMLLFVTGLEVAVSILQAFVFTILAAVYIGGALQPSH